MARTSTPGISLGPVCLLLLLVAGCGHPLSTAPVPQGRDWYFVAGGYRIQTVSQTSSTSTSYSGNYRITTTTTTTATSSGFTGVLVPPRQREPMPPTPGNDLLLRQHPELSSAPFRALQELP